MTKNDRLGVRSILYFINYKMVIVVLYLYLREKFCFFIRTERGKCCGWAWCCLYFDANSTLLGRVADKEHTQETSCEPIP